MAISLVGDARVGPPNVGFTGGLFRDESHRSQPWHSLLTESEPNGQPQFHGTPLVDDFRAPRRDVPMFAVPGIRDAEMLVRVAATFVRDSTASEFDQPRNSATHPPEYDVMSAPAWNEDPDPNSACNCPRVSIQSASIPSNQISVTLAGPGCTGNLQVRITGDGRTYNVSTVAGAGPGTHMIDFGRDTIPEGQYDDVEATWNIRDGLTPDDEYTYRFSALGRYTHSQYTQPSQAHPTCAPDPRLRPEGGRIQR